MSIATIDMREEEKNKSKLLIYSLKDYNFLIWFLEDQVSLSNP